jgi:dipeptidyl aminopeptidase/acylaminoacyl peptidase
MYEYPIPAYARGRINIPWFVSQGYLVFTPDIQYSIASVSGKTVGDAAVNSVVSAAQNLIRLPYVNANKIGIQGHSFGGGETLYIITHSNLFSAACAAAPTVSNEVSAYLGIHYPKGKAGGEYRLSYAELGHDHIGTTLWDRPDLFIKASPVFKADKVATPLLIMHNEEDQACEWSQSLEMYMALRRLEKEVWMLQYDGGDHIVFGKNAIDYTIRMAQFFNHYLKGAPAPIWMTQGIFARLKGIEAGYELDSAGNCGKKCKICNDWNQKYKKNSQSVTEEIKELQKKW